MTRRLRFMLALVSSSFAPLTAHAVCKVTTSDVDGNGTEDLTITGDAGPQTLLVLNSSDSWCVSLDCNSNGRYSDPGDVVMCVGQQVIETITVDLKGRDTISVA